MQVNFTVLGARQFLGIDMHELLDRLVPLEDALGAKGWELAHDLASLNDWDERFAYLFKALEQGLASKKRQHVSSQTVSAALQLIHSKNL